MSKGWVIVGVDKDSDKRQRAAIEALAKAAGYDIVGEFYDAAVSGADPVADRLEMLPVCAAVFAMARDWTYSERVPLLNGQCLFVIASYFSGGYGQCRWSSRL